MEIENEKTTKNRLIKEAHEKALMIRCGIPITEIEVHKRVIKGLDGKETVEYWSEHGHEHRKGLRDSDVWLVDSVSAVYKGETLYFEEIYCVPRWLMYERRAQFDLEAEREKQAKAPVEKAITTELIAQAKMRAALIRARLAAEVVEIKRYETRSLDGQPAFEYWCEGEQVVGLTGYDVWLVDIVCVNHAKYLLYAEEIHAAFRWWVEELQAEAEKARKEVSNER